MNIKIEITGADLRKLIVAELERQMGDVPFSTDDVTIEVKSKQNYKSEWEPADFRANLLVVVS